ncbi:DNA ligase-1 [Naumannella cuiyingiana]|uniref:DNA ligase n=1 Tax=Naumannella cuiyingiana TaxID=1347891 RepID=A0A7Z0IL50_9ACTN|nr:ATP-dependent DNA ligase [Naumannella cuiyingiana]NYI71152.1 DNA ligase-1 [Naumannella cuiyingiana]
MLLNEVAETSAALAATRSRNAKRDLLADLLRRAEPADLPVLTSYLAGELRQRRTGVGWASLGKLPGPAERPTLTLAGVDAAFERIAALSGPGSQGARAFALAELFGAATAPEQRLLRGLVSGELRQGALDAAIVDAVAAASGVPLADLRRAVMLSGATAPVAEAAMAGGAEAVRAFTLEVGRPVRPMLAGSAPDVAAAFAKLSGPVAVDTKLDGIRIQAHKSGDRVRLFTRSLDEVTERLGDVAEVIAALPAEELIIDAEVLASDDRGRPRPFQETAARTATQEVPAGAGHRLVPAIFDVLAIDGEALIDQPLEVRQRRLDQLVPQEYRIRRLDRPDADAARAFFDAVIADGHEGVVIKDLAAPYSAGRRGSGWIKVKPRHTLDLVVLAVERGSGRRRGMLSNIHLGARDPGTGEFVMLGKTFKGMTDEMLAWQTRRFTELADGPVGDDDWVIKLRPEQVVEIAFDGVQRSTRYPGGVALRFARVLRYRDDKRADEADTIEQVRALGAG